MRDWMIYFQVLTAYGLIDQKDFVIFACRSHIKNQGFCNTAHAWKLPWRKKLRDFFLESRETAEALTVVVKWAWKKLCSLVALSLLHYLYTWEEILRDEARTRAIRRWSWFATNPLLLAHLSFPQWLLCQWHNRRSSPENIPSCSFSEGQEQLHSLWKSMKSG